MYKLQHIIILVLLLAFSIDAYSLSNRDQAICDSMFNELQKKKGDSLKLKEMLNINNLYCSKSWFIPLFDRVLNDIDWENENKSKNRLFYFYMLHSGGFTDHDYLLKIYPEIKENAYVTKIFYSYFRCKLLLLSFETAQGKNEYVISKSKEMSIEAKKLGSIDGYVSSKMVLLDLYLSLNKYDSILEVCNSLKSLKNIDKRDYLTILYYKASAYVEKRDCANTIQTISSIKNRMDNEYKNLSKNEKLFLNSNYFYLELLYCKLYNYIGNLKEFKYHLDEAKSLYISTVLPSNIILYYELLAQYNEKTHDWKNAIKEYDFLIKYSQKRNESQLNILSYKRNMAMIYYKTGEYDKAFALLDSLINKSGIIYSNMMKMQHETIRDNYRMERAKITAGNDKLIFFYILIFGGIIVFILFSLFIIHSLIIRKRILNNELIISKSCSLAKGNNKLKETFIKNIRNEIEQPLNAVLNISDDISSGRKLEQCVLENFSNKLGLETRKLIELVENVLFLSRLESGMMKFSFQEYNVKILCDDILSMINENGIKSDVKFIIKDESLIINTDPKCLKKFIISLISETEENTQRSTIELMISSVIYNQHKGINVRIKNSPLLRSNSKDTLVQVKKEIVLLIIKELKWQDMFNEDDKRLNVIIPNN